MIPFDLGRCPHTQAVGVHSTGFWPWIWMWLGEAHWTWLGVVETISVGVLGEGQWMWSSCDIERQSIPQGCGGVFWPGFGCDFGLWLGEPMGPGWVWSDPISIACGTLGGDDGVNPKEDKLGRTTWDLALGTDRDRDRCAKWPWCKELAQWYVHSGGHIWMPMWNLLPVTCPVIGWLCVWLLIQTPPTSVYSFGSGLEAHQVS